MKKTLIYYMVLALTALPLLSCNTSKANDDPGPGTSFVKLHISGTVAYETDIVNAYYMTTPLPVLSLASVKDKNSGGAGPQFTFETLGFDGKPGTTRITHGDGNKGALVLLEDGIMRYDISNRDVSGNRGYLDVTITATRQSGAVQVLTGTFSGKLIGDKKTAIEVSGSFSDHAYPHYGD